MLNDPVFVEAAQALARRMRARGGGDRRGARRSTASACAWRGARSRTRSQLAACRATRERRPLRDRPAARPASSSATSRPVRRGGDAAELAAWTVVASVLLNLDETHHAGNERWTDRRTQRLRAVTRRHFFRQSGIGLGALALASLLERRRSRRRRRRRGGPLAPQAAALRAEGEERHLPVHGRRAVAARPVRPQAEARTSSTASRSRSRSSRASASPSSRACRKLLGSPYAVRAARRVRRRALELLPHLGRGRRRHRDRPLDAHRPVQPRAGPALHEHRVTAALGRPSMGSWLTYGLGSENAEPARLRRAALGPAGPGRAASLLGQRVPADRVPGRPVPLAGRAGPLPLQPAGIDRGRAAARRSTRCAT